MRSLTTILISAEDKVVGTRENVTKGEIDAETAVVVKQTPTTSQVKA